MWAVELLRKGGVVLLKCMSMMYSHLLAARARKTWMNRNIKIKNGEICLPGVTKHPAGG